MSVEWSEARIYKLVLSYIRQECLWKHDSDCYNNLEARKNAYLNIIRDVNIRDLTVSEVKDKIRQIRRTYRLELTRINDANCRGFPYKPNITWFELIHEFLCAYITTDEDSKIDNLLNIDAEQEKYSSDRFNIPLRYSPSLQRRYTIKEYPNGTRYVPIQSNSLDIHPTKLTKNVTSSARGKILSLASLQNDDATISNPNVVSTKQQIASADAAAAVQKTRNNIGSEFRSTAGDYSSIKINYPNDVDVIAKPLQPAAIESVKKQAKVPKKYSDEFDVFGKSVACQLRELSLPHALRTQTKIQSLLAEERINLNQEIEINVNGRCSKKNSHRRRKNPRRDSHATQSSKSSHSTVNYHPNFQCPSASDFSSSNAPSDQTIRHNDHHNQINQIDTFRFNNSKKQYNKKSCLKTQLQ